MSRRERDLGPVSDPRSVQLVIKGSPADPTCAGYLPPEPDPRRHRSARTANAGTSEAAKASPEVSDT